MVRKGNAIWRAGLKDGKGTVSSGSGAVSEASYNFSQRFEEQPGTNPEELIAAAHASCFSMQFAANLENAGFKAESVATTASVTLEPKDGKPTVTKIHLESRAKVPNATPDVFNKAAEAAKTGCPISRLLGAAAEITLDAKLL
jgi:lipoyl-dependent peroxiredoxin